jgi:AraC-like DNA-binding protein
MREQRLRPPRVRSLHNFSPRPAPELLAESDPSSPVQTASVGRILRVKELAQLFHKSPETIKRRLRERKLHGFKLGKEWYAREVDLQQDIRRLRREEEL